jgi:cytoskeletal protein RodZ
MIHRLIQYAAQYLQVYRAPDAVVPGDGGLAHSSGRADALRHERLRRGLKLDQLAAQTKIGSRYLQAMEENRFDRLPGGLFTRSFLRQYEQTLGLTDDQVVHSPQQQLDGPPVLLPEPQRHDKLSHLTRIPMAVWLVTTIFGGGLVSKLWEDTKQDSSETSAMARRSASRGGGASQDSNGARPKVETPATTASKSGSGPEFAAMRVVLTASEPVWLSIKSDGIHTYSGTLEGQQSKEFNASIRMAIVVGNAGGLIISMNGKPVELLGAHGQVELLVLTPNGARVAPRQRPDGDE